MLYDRSTAMQAVRGATLAATELACLFAAGSAAAWLGWSLLTPTGSTGAMAPQPASSLSADLAALRERPDPFLRATVASATTATSATASAEGFTLHSTRALGDKRSSAILSATGLPQQSYAIGDTIGDATLVEVGARHIELERGGRRIRIAFPDPPPSALIPTDTPRQQQSEVIPAQSADRTVLINAMSLKSVARANGGLGLEIIPRGNPAILASVGLAPGDIVVGINGQAINAQSFTEHRSAILSGADVELSFERGGAVMTTRLGD